MNKELAMKLVAAFSACVLGVMLGACASAGDRTGELAGPSTTQAGAGGAGSAGAGAAGSAGSAGSASGGVGGAAGGAVAGAGAGGGNSAGAGASGGSSAPVPTLPLDPNDPLLGGGAPISDSAGCGKIDFLFVVDNSGSMTDEQQNLIDSFPGFIETIQEAVSASDHHVLVIDTDASGGGTSMSTTCSGNSCTCTPAPGCCEALCDNGIATCNGSSCDALPVPDPTSCDTTLGAGKVFRYDGTRCIADMPRYMTHADPALAENFACVANVGTGGDGNEKPMQAIEQALGVMSLPGQCNDGFLRDDAILVVTFITDEEEDPGKSPGDPPDWVADLVALKNGNEEAVVVLGVFGDNDRPDGTCPPGGLMDTEGADPGYRLREFVESFRYGVVGSVCAPDYAPFFTEAVSVIDGACDAFTL